MSRSPFVADTIFRHFIRLKIDCGTNVDFHMLGTKLIKYSSLGLEKISYWPAKIAFWSDISWLARRVLSSTPEPKDDLNLI